MKKIKSFTLDEETITKIENYAEHFKCSESDILRRMISCIEDVNIEGSLRKKVLKCKFENRFCKIRTKDMKEYSGFIKELTNDKIILTNGTETFFVNIGDVDVLASSNPVEQDDNTEMVSLGEIDECSKIKEVEENVRDKKS